MLAFGQFLFDTPDLLLRHLADVVILVAQEFLVFLKLFLEIAILPVGENNRFHVGARLGGLAVLFGIGQHGRVGKALLQFLISFFQTFQFRKHSYSVTVGSGDSKRAAKGLSGPRAARSAATATSS